MAGEGETEKVEDSRLFLASNNRSAALLQARVSDDQDDGDEGESEEQGRCFRILTAGVHVSCVALQFCNDIREV